MTENPEDNKKKAGEKTYIMERGRDKDGIVYDRVIREIEEPPEDNITPFKEALRNLSKELKKTGESATEAAKEAAEATSGISAAIEKIQETIPAAMKQITALTSDIKASEEFKKAQEIAELEMRWRTRELKKKYYKEAFFKLSEKKHAKELEEATPEELEKFRKEFYKAPSWEDIIDEHREAIQTASDTEIKLSTREDGSVLIPGTMYEHYKNEWRGYFTAWKDAKITIINNPTRLEGNPILQHGQVYNALFPLANPENKEYISIEIDGAGEYDKKNNRPVLTLIDIDFNELPKEITKELTSFDGDIFSACFSLCREAAKRNGGGDRDIFPCITTIRDIYNALGNDKAPGGNQLDNIISSIDKLDRARIQINNDNEMSEGYYTGSRLINQGWAHFVHVDYLPMTIKGKKGTQETLYAVRLSPTALMDYIAKKGQYRTIKREYYSLIASSGLYMNDRALAIRNYIIKAIHTQRPLVKGATSILFETLCEKCNISRKAKDKQEKRATDNIIKPILQIYKDGGLIEDYKIIEKEKIIIQVEPAPKLEAGKKKKKKGQG